MKELERLCSVKVYSKAILRVAFPNGCILQGSFHPREALLSIRTFILGALDPVAAGHEFALHTGHPLKELGPEDLKRSIVANGLTPSAIIHFRSLSFHRVYLSLSLT